MKYKKLVVTLMLVCLMSMFGPVSAVSFGAEPPIENLNAPEVASILASAGITPEEAAQLGNLRGIIAGMISSGQVTAQQAQHIVQQHINNPPTVVQPDSNFQGDPAPSQTGNLGIDIISARVIPESVTGGNQTKVLHVGTDAQGFDAKRWYTRIFGATARSNGTDAYEVSFRVMSADTGKPASFTKVDLSGSSALVFDKNATVTDAAGNVNVTVYAKQPGVYVLFAACGQKSVSVEMEFVSKDVTLPTPMRASGGSTNPNPSGAPQSVTPDLDTFRL
jgi:hypothetical protein